MGKKKRVRKKDRERDYLREKETVDVNQTQKKETVCVSEKEAERLCVYMRNKEITCVCVRERLLKRETKRL